MLNRAFVLALGLCGGVSPALAERSTFYTYRGERRVLTLDPSRLALLGAEADRPIPSLGLAAADVTAHAIQGWSLARTQPLAALAADARAIVEVAAADAAIDFASPVFVDDLGGPMFVTPIILVGFKAGTTDAQANASIAQVGAGDVVERGWAGMRGAYRVMSRARSGFEVLDQANALAALPNVAWAEPDMVFTGKGSLVPNDPSYSQCWGLNQANDEDMDVQQAWDITTGSPSIKILIIDTGVDPSHVDLNQVPGFDSTGEGGGGAPVNAFDNHGTGVAGCCSASINNSQGGVGVSPNCPAASARTFITTNAQGNWTSNASMTVNSLAWGESIGVRVTNNSNYYGFTSSAIEQKYADMRNAGVIHFASAGNDGLPVIGYPASLPTVNAIGALTSSGALASFSNSGADLFVAAPGVSVFSTDRTGSAGYSGGDYTFFGGTSAASPCTAGVAALVLSYNPFLSAFDLESIMASSAVDHGPAGFDTGYGWGFVNALAAIQASPPPGPPGVFALTSPSNMQMNVSRTPNFAWSTSINATTYTLEVDDSAAFDSPIFSGVISGVSHTWAGAPLAAATTYHWRVTAMNPLGNSPSSPAAASFTTISTPPGSFALLSPADGATGLSATPSFSWAAAPFAESYTIRIDNDADFSSPITNAGTVLTMFNQTAPLAGNMTYYWTVTANNPIGGTPASPAVRSFTTLLLPPAAFSLLSPADGVNVPTRTPTLQWSASGGAASYTLVVDDAQTLDSPAVSEAGLAALSFDIPPGALVNNTRYYWRVTSMNPAGNVHGSPSVASFGVLVPPCQGDANDDGQVNFADISSTLANWGSAGPNGDSNHDGMVNFVDISTALANWLGSCS